MSAIEHRTTATSPLPPLGDAGRPNAAVARRVNAERVVLFGWSRAILMQLAHPLIAAGVADHSTFRVGPVAAAMRLHHTVRAMLAFTFGDEATRAAELATIRSIHRRVNGTLRGRVGAYAAGTPYSAEDPSLVLWVHATLLDSVLLAYQAFVGPLSEEDQDAFCVEAAQLAIDLRARPEAVPRTAAALLECVHSTIASGQLCVGDDARAVAAAVLKPPVPVLTWPAAAMNQVITAGLLPPPLRAAYGFKWSAARERRYTRAVALLRAIRSGLPPMLALWPEARRRQ